MIALALSAFAGTPTLTAVPEADRPPMIKGGASCIATIAHDATGKATAADVAAADCPELFRASTKMAAEKVVLSGVAAPGAITLRYTYAEGNGVPTVDPASMPVLGLKYSGIEPVAQKAPKWPKGAEETGPVTCTVSLVVDPTGLPTDVQPSGCHDAFGLAVQDALKKWQFTVPPNPPEGGVPTEIAVTFTPK